MQNNVEPLVDHNITSAAGTDMQRALVQIYAIPINSG